MVWQTARRRIPYRTESAGLVGWSIRFRPLCFLKIRQDGMAKLFIMPPHMLDQLGVRKITLLLNAIVALLHFIRPLLALLVITMEIDAGLDICSRGREAESEKSHFQVALELG